ncbi:MAG: glycine cleavage system protein GcvH [Candidatus Izemoplasmatales bacterium]|jgi:glycine cleavage system H protein|nr:glycine cleavage system protein GcvH [Candidatus Izemoplasmatales bacterium]MDD4355464.1 glycine cleavage system protein GcvH [Candidatus Izemoplasmatales bacterium]MDD4987752.1 glycine cleavage system protein GcvH [Candidatus Izemoplasmatales bacterium]MDY0373233.1 glycine cleavage system protein GcvH [Candidatus Izemoplasmatales bacterium]
MSKVPMNLFYARTHEWVKVEGNVALVGITDFAQHQLGSVVFVDLPEIGSVLKQNKEFGAVESVKAASDLMSPVSGKVIEQNDEVVGDPEQVNRDPYNSWFIKIEMSDPKELDALLKPNEYEEISR